MIGSLGFAEILFILVLALLVFGPRRLPEVGRTLGRALGEFRRATGDLKRSFDREIGASEDAEALTSIREDVRSALDVGTGAPRPPADRPTPGASG